MPDNARIICKPEPFEAYRRRRWEKEKRGRLAQWARRDWYDDAYRPGMHRSGNAYWKEQHSTTYSSPHQWGPGKIFVREPKTEAN